jgi:hypothetical protein
MFIDVSRRNVSANVLNGRASKQSQQIGFSMGTKTFGSIGLSESAKKVVYLSLSPSSSLSLSSTLCTVARPKRGIEYKNCAKMGRQNKPLYTLVTYNSCNAKGKLGHFMYFSFTIIGGYGPFYGCNKFIE